MSSTREQELTAWLSDKGYDSSSLSVLSADASFRPFITEPCGKLLFTCTTHLAILLYNLSDEVKKSY